MEYTQKYAVISDCGKYRYTLLREWKKSTRKCVFIGLNPSTADGVEDDPTIRREVRFASDWGFGGLIKLNLFAYRATSPAVMLKAKDPVGPENDRWLRALTKDKSMVVAAWGNFGVSFGRALDVIQLLDTPIYHLGMTKQHQPRHPLYLKATTKLQLIDTNEMISHHRQIMNDKP